MNGLFVQFNDYRKTLGWFISCFLNALDVSSEVVDDSVGDLRVEIVRGRLCRIVHARDHPPPSFAR